MLLLSGDVCARWSHYTAFSAARTAVRLTAYQKRAVPSPFFKERVRVRFCFRRYLDFTTNESSLLLSERRAVT